MEKPFLLLPLLALAGCGGGHSSGGGSASSGALVALGTTRTGTFVATVSGTLPDDPSLFPARGGNATLSVDPTGYCVLFLGSDLNYRIVGTLAKDGTFPDVTYEWNSAAAAEHPITSYANATLAGAASGKAVVLKATTTFENGSSLSYVVTIQN